MIAFLAVVLSVMTLMYGYTGWRLIGPLRLGAVGNGLAALAILALMLAPWLVHGRRAALPASVQSLLAWVAYVGLGFVLLTWLLLVGRDLAWLALAAGRRLAAFAGWRSPLLPGPDPERRRFVLNALNLGVTAVSASLVGCGLYGARRGLRTERVMVPVPNLPAALEGLRILHLSDLHAGLTIRRDFVERVVAHCSDVEADLIALTGDLVDGEVAQLRADVEPLARLRAPLGKFFVTGNHEYYNGEVEGWLGVVRELGFTVLVNQHRVLEREGARLLVAGVPDHDAGSRTPGHRPDPRLALAGAPAADVRLLLAHQPRVVEAASSLGVDLQLSGHTHGGQFYPWNLAVGLQQPYVAGLHRHGPTWIYVTRGAGYWGPPLRLGIPAEVAVLTLTAA